jgi:serine/threonine protein kinase
VRRSCKERFLIFVSHSSPSSDEFIKLLGRGTFSQVLQCRDLAATAPTDVEMLVDSEESSSGRSSGSSNTSSSGMVTIPLKPRNVVAIKVIRDVARYRHAAEKEARILQHLAATKHNPHPARPAPELQTARGMQQDSRLGVYGVNPLLGWFRMGGHMVRKEIATVWRN